MPVEHKHWAEIEQFLYWALADSYAVVLSSIGPEGCLFSIKVFSPTERWYHIPAYTPSQLIQECMRYGILRNTN